MMVATLTKREDDWLRVDSVLSSDDNELMYGSTRNCQLKSVRAWKVAKKEGRDATWDAD